MMSLPNHMTAIICRVLSRIFMYRFLRILAFHFTAIVTKLTNLEKLRYNFVKCLKFVEEKTLTVVLHN